MAVPLPNAKSNWKSKMIVYDGDALMFGWTQINTGENCLVETQTLHLEMKPACSAILTIATISRLWMTAACCCSQDTCSQLRSRYTELCLYMHYVLVYIGLWNWASIESIRLQWDIFNLSILRWCSHYCVNCTWMDDLRLAISFDMANISSYYCAVYN